MVKLDEKTFAVGYANGKIEVWNYEGKCLQAFQLDSAIDNILHLSIGFIACYCSEVQPLHIYNVYTAKRIQTINLNGIIKKIFKYDNTHLLAYTLYNERKKGSYYDEKTRTHNIVKFHKIPENRLEPDAEVNEVTDKDKSTVCLT